MPQFSKGDTFSDGQQVTGVRLNGLVDNATALPGLITDQTNLTANTVASGDSVLLHDLSANALREATANDLLNSNLSITTSSITGGANSDISVTPNDGTTVTGSSYTSSNGLTVVVTTSAAHGLSVGQVILISGASSSSYNGTFKITAVTSTTFTYVMPVAATAGSGALSYLKKGSIRNNNNEVISGNLFVDGNSTISGTTSLIGNTTINGTTTANGTTNLKAEVQYNGVAVYGLASITETTVSPLQFDATTSAQVTATCNIWRTLHTISSLTKTNKEIWEVLADFPVLSYGYNGFRMRLLLVSTNTVLGETSVKVEPVSGVAYQYQYSQQKISVVIPEGTVLTNDSIRLEGFYAAFQALAGAIAWAGYTSAYWSNPQTSKVRVTKYIKP